MHNSKPIGFFVARVAAWVAVALCLLSFHPRGATAAGAVEMQVDRIVKIAIVEYNSAMREGDPARWVKYFTDNVKLHRPQSSLEGLQAFADYYAWEFRNFEAKWDVRRMMISGRSAAVEYTWDAVHKPSGTPVKLDVVVILEMASSGKFESADFYFDPAGSAEYFAGAPGAK